MHQSKIKTIGSRIRNERGIALVSVYMVSVMIIGISGAAFSKSFSEMNQVNREVARLRAYSAAEAGLQNALAQIGVQAYTGFINTNQINVANFVNVNNTQIGSSGASYSVTLDYPQEADWVIVHATATVDNETRTLEGRVFLDSNLSKYLVFANTTTFSSGNDAQYGEPDYTDEYGDGEPDYPELVHPNEDERAALYFTGTWNISGSAVHLYGDAHAQTSIAGNSGSYVHGDTYSSAFTLNGSGQVTNDGVSGGLNIGDGFDDDIDRNQNSVIDALDFPDIHDLTADGDGDAHAIETLQPIDTNFYKNNNNIPTFGGASAQSRYIELVPSVNGTTTQVKEYNNASYSQLVTTHNLPSKAIVYVNGDVYVKGQISGRISVVSSDDIFFQGNTTYANGQTHADPDHSAAFMAKDVQYMRADDLTVSGILYAQNSSNASAAFDANYNTSGQVDPDAKTKLRLFGNRIIKGGTNLSIYPDRVYGYDKNLKYFRPPGIPVYPDLRTVRDETAQNGGGAGV